MAPKAMGIHVTFTTTLFQLLILWGNEKYRTADRPIRPIKNVASKQSIAQISGPQS